MTRDACVGCNAPHCEKTWPRDPALEVVCPTCGAAVGRPCVARRPSGHVHSRKFAGLDVHNERDLLACAEGKYGVCPEGRCGIPPDEARRRLAAGETKSPKHDPLTQPAFL
jgi:hypothetical protein